MKSKTYFAVGLVALFALAILVPQELDAQNSGYIRRFAADHRTWGSAPGAGPLELITGIAASGVPPGSGGFTIYDKTFFVANDINTLYVTISATGDVHDGASMQFSCLVDRGDGAGAVACNPGGNPIGLAPPGWVTLQRHVGLGSEPGLVYGGDGGGGPSDQHDNVVTYTWCTPFETTSGVKRVQIRMASLDGEGSGIGCPLGPGAGPNPCVFIEGVHFYIDGSRIRGDNRCADLDATDGVGGPPCPDCGPVPQ